MVGRLFGEVRNTSAKDVANWTTLWPCNIVLWSPCHLKRHLKALASSFLAERPNTQNERRGQQRVVFFMACANT